MNTAINAKLWNIMDMLQRLDFTPEEHPLTMHAEDWFIRPVAGGTQNLRVVVHPDDDNAVYVHYLDRHYVSEWTAAFDGSVPNEVIRQTLKAAINA